MKNNLTIDDILKAKESLPKPPGNVFQAMVTSPHVEAKIVQACADSVTPQGGQPFLGLAVYTLIEMAEFNELLCFATTQGALDFIKEVKVARAYGDPIEVIKRYFDKANNRPSVKDLEIERGPIDLNSFSVKAKLGFK